MSGSAVEVPGAALARFWESCGRRVIEMEGVLWAEYRGPFLVSLPYQLRIDLDPERLSSAMRARRAWAVRFPTRTQPGLPSGLFVAETRGYSLARVHHHERRAVRRGLARCEIRAVAPDVLVSEGLQLNRETMARQRRFDPAMGEAASWQQLVQAITSVTGVSVTGAFVEGRLSAYAVTCRDLDWLHVLFRMARTTDLRHGANPALDFSLIANAEPGIVAVTHSGLSVSPGAESLHEYKRRLGYRVAAHDLAIRLHPSVEPALTTRPVVAAARALASIRPGARGPGLLAEVLRGARRSRDGARASRAITSARATR